MPNLEKNKQIKEKCTQTKLHHKSMCCRVYTLKIKENKLNLSQKETLERYFICSKWVYNYILQIGQRLKYIGTEHTEFKPVEILASSDVGENYPKAKYESMNQEAIIL